MELNHDLCVEEAQARYVWVARHVDGLMASGPFLLIVGAVAGKISACVVPRRVAVRRLS